MAISDTSSQLSLYSDSESIETETETEGTKTSPCKWQSASSCCAWCCGISCSLVLIFIIASSIFLWTYKLESQCEQIIEDQLNGKEQLGWWDMDGQSIPLQKMLQNELAPYDMEEFMPTELKNLSVWSKGSAAEVARIMYEGTHFPGVVEQIPQQLRGVYWMSGNALPDELTVLQYGRWFAGEKTYWVPYAPFMWAYPDGTPEDAPFGGFLYEYPNGPQLLAARLMSRVVSFSYAFDFCPWNADYCGWSSSDMAWANMNVHPWSNLRLVSSLGQQILEIGCELTGFCLPSGTLSTIWTLEDWPPAEIFKRPSYFQFLFFPTIEAGTYDLTMIIDGDGKPVEPYYSDFIAYMGDIPLFMWTGFKNAAAQSAAQAYYTDPANSNAARSSTLYVWLSVVTTWTMLLM